MAGRPGLVEHHPRRREIEEAILARVPFRAIACQFGVGRESVRRYVERMPAELAAAYRRELESPNSDLIADLREFYGMLKRMAREAELTHDREAKHLALKAINQALPYARAIGEFRGDLAGNAPSVNVLTINVIGATDWMAKRAIEVPAEVLPAGGNGNGQRGTDENISEGDHE